MVRLWSKICSENGSLQYEGFTLGGKAFGPGTSFYENGRPCHEGIFGIKGLHLGREYYPNGQIRFEGLFKLNTGYGPNRPEYGTWYSESGEKLFHGEFRVNCSGLGFPFVKTPENYGKAYYSEGPNDFVFMWEDAEKAGVRW